MLALDPRTTALILIDVQKGVLSMPLAPYGASQIVQNAARLGRGRGRGQGQGRGRAAAIATRRV